MPCPNANTVTSQQVIELEIEKSESHQPEPQTTDALVKNNEQLYDLESAILQPDRHLEDEAKNVNLFKDEISRNSTIDQKPNSTKEPMTGAVAIVDKRNRRSVSSSHSSSHSHQNSGYSVPNYMPPNMFPYAIPGATYSYPMQFPAYSPYPMYPAFPFPGPFFGNFPAPVGAPVPVGASHSSSHSHSHSHTHTD